MASSSKFPMIAGTLQTDPRSGGLKRSSGVNVLPVVAESEWNPFWIPCSNCVLSPSERIPSIV